MKYLFCVAIGILAYAIVGILTYPPQHLAVAQPAKVIVATEKTSPVGTSNFRIIRVVSDSSPQVPVAVTALEPKSTADFIVEVQRRLAEANCYTGADDGKWSGSTQDAARRFIAGARAELPSDQASEALLALLRSRGDDKSLCAAADSTIQSVNTDTTIRNADATAELGQPMGLGAGNSTGYAYYSNRGEDHAFRHPLGGF